MGTDIAAAPPQATPPVGQRLVYDGRLGALYRIFFENLLFGIITLGIYRFWGRTRYRRYLWSHTSYDGDRFEYTGRGGELFRGFLIAIAIFLPLIIGVGALQAILIPSRPGLFFAIAAPVYLALMVLFFAARYTALRYRLTRTRWRGIRGGLAGSAINFALRSIGYGILSLLTLYQFVPFASVRLWRYRLNNLFFGTAPASFAGRGRDLYPRYLASFIISLGAGAVIALVIFLLLRHDIASLSVGADVFDANAGDAGQAETDEAPASPMDPARYASIERLIFAGFAGYIVWALVGLVVYLWYVAFALRYITGGTRLAGLSVTASVTAGKLFRLMVGNLLLYVFTLGFGYPIVIHRLWRFGANNFTVHGEIDGATIAQSQLEPPRTGEGWLEVLDPGFI
ncbi:MAG TPA: YjgN family protein [Dongiaceae bacterium]|nr:YjgN family protein [Dongiaceae bacterium]